MGRYIQVIRDAIVQKPFHGSSDPTDKFACAVERSVTERAGRLEQLVQEFAEGRYKTDLPAVSKAILKEMRATGHEAPDT
jgi:hypothetical protein